jgi:pyruvate ferredoxin oxidoreductase gamma subunit
MKFNKDAFEIIFFARAGQGAKTAAEIIAQSAVREGKFVQAFPFFGPERSGAPTRAYVRVSDEPIRQHEPVTDPDLVVVLDETLLSSQDVSKNLDRDESLIINTKKSPEEVRKEVNHFTGAIHSLDALSMALQITGQPSINSVILGKLIKVSEIVKLESLIEEFRKLFEKKLGKELTDKNIQAIQEGYDAI